MMPTQSHHTLQHRSRIQKWSAEFSRETLLIFSNRPDARRACAGRWRESRLSVWQISFSTDQHIGQSIRCDRFPRGAFRDQSIDPSTQIRSRSRTVPTGACGCCDPTVCLSGSISVPAGACGCFTHGLAYSYEKLSHYSSSRQTVRGDFPCVFYIDHDASPVLCPTLPVAAVSHSRCAPPRSARALTCRERGTGRGV